MLFYGCWSKVLYGSAWQSRSENFPNVREGHGFKWFTEGICQRTGEINYKRLPILLCMFHSLGCNYGKRTLSPMLQLFQINIRVIFFVFFMFAKWLLIHSAACWLSITVDYRLHRWTLQSLKALWHKGHQIFYSFDYEGCIILVDFGCFNRETDVKEISNF